MKNVIVDVPNNSIKCEKDDIGYSPLADDGHDPVEGWSLGFR